MKKIILFILSFLCCINVVFAKDIEINNSIIEFNDIDGYNLQGFTTTNTHLFAVLISKDDSKSIIKVFDLNSYKEILTINGGSLGHANDVTYNSKKNEIYVISASGSSRLNIFDGNNFRYKSFVDLNMPVRSITYLDDLDKYAVRLVTAGYILDNEFNSNKFPFIIGMNAEYDVGRQGWAYYNNLIYYTNWSWVRKGGDGSNSILVYDLDGNRIEEYLTGNNIGEIEDIAFYKDKMILGFNCYDGKIRFFLENIPVIESDDKDIDDKTEIILEKKDDSSEESNNYVIIGISIFLIILSVIIFFIKKKTSNK